MVRELPLLLSEFGKRKEGIVREKGKRLWLFIAVLMMALTISPAASVFAGGSSSGGGGGGSSVGGSGSGKGVPVPPPSTNWTLPPITKRILLPDSKTQFEGYVKFNLKVTLTGRALGLPVSKAESNAFTISFSGKEMKNGNSVANDFDINDKVRALVGELESQLNKSPVGPVPIGKPYDQIIVEVSESESSGHLDRIVPDENTVRMVVQVIRSVPNVTAGPDVDLTIPNVNIHGPEGGLNPPRFNSDLGVSGPKVDIEVPDVDVHGPDVEIEGPPGPGVRYHVIAGQRTFVNNYTPDTPDCPNVCPKPNQGNCKQNNCNSGCPDINININNENNSSANNNNENNNTNVGRDQYNVNQASNPNLTLDRYNHFAYVHGYPDHSFRPEGTITRGEMTAIFRRLLDQGIFSGGNGTQFRDVRAGDWYASDVSRLSSLGVIAGYPDGSFRPNASVTRAEFANVASKFVNAKSGQGFSDLNGHWAQGAIEKLRSAGWVTGYGDGSFRPDAVITRAEVVSITNRMLERSADANYVRNNRGSLIQYTDLPTGHWAYLPIMEASNAHDYTRNADGSETWTRNWK